MLVLLGPAFEPNDSDYERLAQLTGLLPYDLRTRLKPGNWGVVRVLADAGEAADLVTRLQARGLAAVLVDPMVAYDAKRQFVLVEKIELRQKEAVLTVRERPMSIPYAALLTVVRGQTHAPEPRSGASGTSSPSLRALSQSVPDPAGLTPQHFMSYQVADLHFATVLWAARVDARKTDLSAFGSERASPAQRLDELARVLAAKAGLRVDSGGRVSNLGTFAEMPPPMRSMTPAPGAGVPPGRSYSPTQSRFDGYSRLVAEAERRSRGLKS